jgi:hypothetical protein
MLASAGLSDDAAFPHPACKEDLAESVVDFVRAGVEKILALQIDFCAAESLRKALRQIKRSRTPGEIAEQFIELALKSRVSLCAFVFGRQVIQRGHQRLGDEHAAVGTEVAVEVGELLKGGHRKTSNVQRLTSNVELGTAAPGRL